MRANNPHIKKDENAILILCEKVLDLHGRLFINIGLLGDKYEGYVDEQENEYDVFYLEDNISTKDVKVLEDYNEYCNGAYGVYIQKDDEGNYQYDYGYQLMELYQCNKPPIERYYPIIGPIFDEIEEGIIEMVDKLELNQ